MKAWEEVQHSDDAKKMMKDYLVGYCSEVSPKTDRSLFLGRLTSTSRFAFKAYFQPETVGQTAMGGKTGIVTRY
jgi:hypothetical protein